MTDDGRHLFDEQSQSRKRLTIAAAIAFGLVALLRLTGIGSSFDLRLFDAWFSVRGAREPSSQVVIVAMDDKSIGRFKQYPWPRDVYVKVIENLNKAGAKVIGFDVVFDPSRDDPADVAKTEQLATAMTAAKNVVVGFLFDNFPDESAPAGDPPPVILSQAVPTFSDEKVSPLPAPVVVSVDEKIAGAAAALGHVNALPDDDGNIRWSPVLVKHGARSYPSLALQIARVYQGTRLQDVAVGQRSLTVGYADLPLSERARLLLNWTSSDPQFPMLSFADIYDGDFRAELVKDKAVIVAMTARGLDEKNFPFKKNAPGALMHATVLDNIFKLQFLSWPPWAWLFELGVTLGLGALGVLLYPRLRTGLLLAVGPALLVLLTAVTLFLFIVQGIWLKEFYPAMAVLFPFVAVVSLRMRETERESRDVVAEKVDSQKLLGLSFQEKGMLDLALATFSKLPMTEDMKQVYLNLGMDFENRGMREKAFLAYKRIVETDAAYEDVAPRLEALRRAGVGTRIFHDSTVAGGGTMGLPATMQHAPGTMGPGPTAIVDDHDGDVDATRGLESATAGPRGTQSSAPTAGIGAATAGVAPTGAGLQSTARGGQAAGDRTQGVDRTQGIDATLDLPRPGPGMSRLFGRYEILDKLGKGAMGEVFKVRDPKIGRIAAMKTIRVDQDLSPQQMIEMRQRFYREAQTAGKLTHANIVTIYDVGEEQGVSYIVMEFVEGQTLTSLMKKNKTLTVNQVKHLIVASALGLDYAHQNGVVHRDVKPDNIMISKQGSVIKVMDFGIARTFDSDMTKTGSVLGTPAYMSPEQFSGAKVDKRSDVFSLGVVLYELLSRVRPFKGATPTAVMFEILQKDPIPPSQANNAVDPLWDPIVLKALAKKPEERYQTAQDLANAVRSVQAK